MPTSSAPPVNQSVNEGFHEIVEGLCRHFSGLSPFEIMNTDLRDVYDLYIDVAVHDYKASKQKNTENAVWVTSKTASWH